MLIFLISQRYIKLKVDYTIVKDVIIYLKSMQLF